MPNKFAHVKNATLADGAKDCAWPGCKVQVPLARWGCQDHWALLPKLLRTRIWEAYTLGQETDLGQVRQEYLDAASAAERWITSFLAANRAVNEP